MHFFIDHTKLPAQSPSHKKFGPDSSNPTTVFYLSTEFQLTQEAKAFACQAGMMIVQKINEDEDGDGDLVNLIIKPLIPIRLINGITVRYYIYRGLKLNSFFTPEGNIVPQNNASKSDFISSFWKRWNELPSVTPPPTPLNIGFGDNDFPVSDSRYLNSERPIKDIFDGKTPAKAQEVTEGMWLGYFATSTSIKFEIELETELGFALTLNSYRALAPYAISLDDETSELELKRSKELVLSYIDPAAFFGMHATSGVKTHDAAKPRKISGDLYTVLISKFSNKNRVYLDIRSEKGLSYNFYNNYKVSPAEDEEDYVRNIVINAASGLNTISGLNGAAIPYGISGWPIHFFETINHHDNADLHINKVRIRLRIDGNIEPVLFLENNELSVPNLNDESHPKFRFYRNNVIKDNAPQTAWTREITFYFPDARDPSHNNLSNYIKAYYYLGSVMDETDEVNPRLLNKKYFDSAFCSIDLAGLGDTSITKGSVENSAPIFIKEPLHDDGTGNFSFAAQSGAFWDYQNAGSHRIIFYSKSYVKRPDMGSKKKYISTDDSRKITLNNSIFQNGLGNDFYIVCKRYDTSIATVEFIKIIGLNSYHPFNQNKQREFQEKENLMLLGFTTAQIQEIKTSTALSEENPNGLSSYHPRYIFLQLDPDGFLNDLSAHRHRYYKYSVKVQGLNSDGIPTIVSPSPAVTVYSRDNQFFSTTDFAEPEELSAGENRVEYRIYENGSIYINDNIDLALLRKSINVQNEHTVQADQAVENDISLVQRIYYLYYADNRTPTDVCNFNFVMANAMAKGGDATTSAVVPTGFLPYLNYSNGLTLSAYRDTFDSNNDPVENATGDIITSDKAANVTPFSMTRYRKQKEKGKVFMVHFVTANTNTTNIVFNASNNNLGLLFKYTGAGRRFINPFFAAQVLGALLKNSRSIECTGFAYGDSSCTPSSNHVNGLAMDCHYLKGPTDEWQQTVDLMHDLDSYGVTYFITGPDANTKDLNKNINDEPAAFKSKIDTGDSIHKTHLHVDVKKSSGY